MAQSTQDYISQEIVDALHYWLSYINTVAKSDILLESSIRYALCEYIERQVNVACAIEVKHPCFPTRFIDFVWDNDIKAHRDEHNYDINKEEIISDSDSCYILECKYTKGVSNNVDERQRIFNDLCRLYYLKKKYTKVHAIFLMAGNAAHFYNSFQNAQTRAKVDVIFNKNANPSKIDEQQEFGKEIFEDLTLLKPKQPIYRASFYDWFRFDQGGEKTINSVDAKNTQNYKGFIDTYFKKTNEETTKDGQQQEDPLKTGYEEQITFKTKLLAINKDTIDGNGRKKHNPCKFQNVAVWEILIDE